MQSTLHKQILVSQYASVTVHNTLPTLPLATPFGNDNHPHLNVHNRNTKRNHPDSHLELHVLIRSFIPLFPHSLSNKVIITFRQLINPLKYLLETFLDDQGNICNLTMLRHFIFSFLYISTIKTQNCRIGIA